MDSKGTRRNGFGKVLQDVRDQPALFVVFTAYKTFALLILAGGGGFILPHSFAVGGYTFPLLVVFMLACAGVCVFFAFRFTRIDVFRKSEYLWFLAISMVMGVFFLFMEAHAGISNDAFRFATQALGIALLAAGLMGIHIELGRLFGMLGMTPTLTYGIASALATALLGLGIMLLDPVLQWVLAFLLPALIVLAFFYAKEKAFPDPKALYRETTSDLLIPYRFMATSVSQGLMLGIPLGFFGLSGAFGHVQYPAGYLVAALLALVVVLVLQMDFNRAVYQIGFPVAGCGLLAMGLLGPASAVAGVLQVAGFLYLDLVLWGLGSYLIKNCDQPATWVASCPTTALMTGRALGMVVGCVALQSLAGQDQVAAFFCTLAFLGIMAALLLSSSANLRTGWGFVRPGDPEESGDSNRTCEIIAQEFGLTQRELEIMVSIVGGKSRKDIAEDLYITPNTIKTHLHNMYGKLDIHSEADLKAFVARREKMFTTDEALLVAPGDD